MAKITTYPTATSISDTDVLLLDGPNGTRKITVKSLFQLMATKDATIKELKDWKTAVLAGNTSVLNAVE